MPHQDEKPGYGEGRFVLGHGKGGTFGHVELFLQSVPEPGFCAVEWQVRNGNPARDARGLVEKAAEKYLRAYVGGHPEHGFRATIVNVISDAVRCNDYERAVNLALRSALEDIGLLPPQIFGP